MGVLGAVAKLAKSKKGEIGPEEISALFEALDMELELETLDVRTPEAAAALTRFCHTAGRKGSYLQRISAVSKNGDRVTALMVITPAGEGLKDAGTKVLGVPNKLLA